MGDSRELVEESFDYLISHPPNLQYVGQADRLFIAAQLRKHKDLRLWSQKPLLYIVLRMLQNEEDHTAMLSRAGWSHIDDLWLPIDTKRGNYWDELAVNVDRDAFRKTQRYVLSRPENMTLDSLRETATVHKHIQSGQDYFNDGPVIGSGGSAEVYQVHHQQSGEVFACKRMMRGKLKGQEDQVRLFAQEIQILRRLNHRHIVRLIASYTDLESFALILYPIADESLGSMLSRELSNQDRDILRQSFGCLAVALEYLHVDRQIRHKDIKPANILLRNGIVYLCDFGISHAWSDDGVATTIGQPPAYTPGYCAPEVFEQEPRNETSDVWSLGRVFCDIVTVLKNQKLEDMEKSIGGARMYYAPEAMGKWLLDLKTPDINSPDNFPIDWAISMVRNLHAESVWNKY